MYLSYVVRIFVQIFTNWAIKRVDNNLFDIFIDSICI